MALEEEASKEISRLDKVRTKLKPLHDRHDTDHSQWRLDKFTIPDKEGKWESFTDNKPKADCDMMTDYIADAKRKLWIELDIDALTEQARTNVSAVEHLGSGVIGLVDRALAVGIEGGTVQSLLSWFAVHRGATVKRYILRQEDGILVPDLAIWDIRNTFWIPGSKGLVWGCLEKKTTPEDIKDEFPDWKGSYTSEKEIIVDIVYDKEEEGVIVNKEYIKPKEKHGLDYIPIHIRPCGSTPMIQDENEDSIKDWGESWNAPNREMNPDYNRAMCYLKTRAGELAKPIKVTEYDSTKGGLPIKLDTEPKKGDRISVDVGRGEKIGEWIVPSSGTDIGVFLGLVSTARETGGLSDIAKGILNQTQTAQGLDIAYHAALGILKPFMRTVELDLIWIAEETARQFKDQKFTESELQGYDNNGRIFKTKVEHEQINENWRFSCRLSPDLHRDLAAQIINAKALTEGENPLTSSETARDMLPFIDDTDIEAEKVAREKARLMMGIGELEAFLALVHDWAKTKDPGKLFILDHAYKQLMVALQQGGATTEVSGDGTKPTPQPVTTQPKGGRVARTARTAQSNIPPEVSEAARGRQNA